MMQIVATGLNHRSAPIELREQFAVGVKDLPAALQKLYSRPGVQEAVILSTCNRVELYTVEDDASSDRGSASFFSDYFGVPEADYISHLYRLYDEKSVRHLFSVASSLDSMIVGEPQILGQVKEYFAQAQMLGTTGRIFNQLFSRALNVGKRTRTETAIGEMAVSVPYAAVELAKKVFDSLKGKSVSLLGRGKMSELTARHLKRSGVEAIYCVNRHHERAIEFATKIGGTPLTYTEDLEFLVRTDILICSTNAPHHLIETAALDAAMSRRKNRMLLLVDISVPRAIDPAADDLSNVYLFNIDHLQDMVAENRRLRMEEARKASSIIEEEVQNFLEWMQSLDLVPTIRAFREHLEAMRSDELTRWLGKLQSLDPEQRELVEQFSRSLVNKIGHMPTSRLKDAPDAEKAAQYGDILRHLFGLERMDK